jgi:hypothetical protein
VLWAGWSTRAECALAWAVGHRDIYSSSDSDVRTSGGSSSSSGRESGERRGWTPRRVLRKKCIHGIVREGSSPGLVPPDARRTAARSSARSDMSADTGVAAACMSPGEVVDVRSKLVRIHGKLSSSVGSSVSSRSDLQASCKSSGELVPLRPQLTELGEARHQPTSHLLRADWRAVGGG